jgi:lactate dehydrogenase-like 2-hydroxyacid dehydrogenase
VILINTSRGDVLDIKVLAKAIGEGKVAAAGLDVLPEKGDIRDEAVKRILSTTVGNIASFTRGESENVIPDERM